MCHAESQYNIKLGNGTISGMDEDSNTSNGGRGLLTDAERSALAGDRSDSDEYNIRSHLKIRIEKISHDADLLAEHAPDSLMTFELQLTQRCGEKATSQVRSHRMNRPVLPPLTPKIWKATPIIRLMTI